MQWQAISNKLPDVWTGKFKVRLKDGKEMDAFFYQDAMSWIGWYGQKTSHWWDAHMPHERLDDVTQWLSE